MPRRTTTIGATRVLALCVPMLLTLISAAPAGAAPTLQPSYSVVGPTAAIVGVGGLAIARDGTGGLIYAEKSSGGTGIYVSRLIGGGFQAPQQVDSGLGGTSSDPVIAATDGGVIAVAFLNGGNLYVNQVPNTTSSFSAPTMIAAGAQSPAISMSTFGKAYLAFTVSGGGGSDVRCAYYYDGTWALESSPLNAVAGDDAGSGSGRPAVVAAGDGTGIVAWGENGHIYVRRVVGTAPSVEVYQADPSSVGGWQELSADEPSIGAGGDSSYVTVAYRETLRSGSSTQTRVLTSRLVAAAFEAPVGADGLSTPGSGSAADPVVLVGEYGSGFVIDSGVSTHDVFALPLKDNGVPTAVTPVTSDQNEASPDATGGTAGLFSSVIAWQEQPFLGLAKIELEFATDGGKLGPEQGASNPLYGPTVAQDGIAAAGDVNGDAVVAWVQGIGPTLRIVAAQLYQPPGGLSLDRVADTNSAQPTLAWAPSKEVWGPVTYSVLIDGTLAGTTAGTSFRPATPLADGTYTWQVIATNQVGLTAKTGVATIHVDTLAPRVTALLGGRDVVGSVVRLRVLVDDLRPGEAATGSSGIAGETVDWGDGPAVPLHGSATHVYAAPGVFHVVVTVSDRAGNTTTVSRYVRIVARPASGPVRRLG